MGLANPNPNPNLAQETVHAQRGVDRVPRTLLHMCMDGRDTPPTSGARARLTLTLTLTLALILILAQALALALALAPSP